MAKANRSYLKAKPNSFFQAVAGTFDLFGTVNPVQAEVRRHVIVSPRYGATPTAADSIRNVFVAVGTSMKSAMQPTEEKPRLVKTHSGRKK